MKMIVAITAGVLALAAAGSAPGEVSYTSGTYSQNFDSLDAGNANTALSWTNNFTLVGWYLFRQPAPGTALTTYESSAGNSTTGTFYSFGVAGTNPNSDRALGGVGSGGTYFSSPATGAVAGWWAVGIQNGTGATTFSSFTVSYDGEQWRNGGNTSPQTLAMEYGIGPSFAFVPSWTAAGASFNFTSPTVGATASLLDGNDPANRQAGLGGTIAQTWAPSDILWLRWIENNDAGSDHGLAIDNFSFSATPIPEPTVLVLLITGMAAGAAVYVQRKE